MFRYFTYSSLAHIGVISFLVFGNLFRSSPKDYYMVDFMAGGGGGGAGRQNTVEERVRTRQAAAPAKAPEPAKVKAVNPAEDLLLKSKDKKKQKEREVVTKTMPIPAAIPVPRPLETRKEAGGVPSPIPSVGGGTGEGSASGAGSGSGIGIGVGDGLGGSGSGTGGAGNFPYAWYVDSVKKKLDANWRVTSGFDRRIFTQMAFTIGRSGSLSDIEVEESSGNPAFDLAARRAVEYSNPLPPLPQGYDEPNLRIHVRFTVKN